MAILRIDSVLSKTGQRSKTRIYGDIQAGLFTKPVPIGQRAVGWPDYEVEAIVAAQIAGLPDEDRRNLVANLHGQRAERFKVLMTPATTGSASTSDKVVSLAVSS